MIISPASQCKRNRITWLEDAEHGLQVRDDVAGRVEKEGARDHVPEPRLSVDLEEIAGGHGERRIGRQTVRIHVWYHHAPQLNNRLLYMIHMAYLGGLSRANLVVVRVVIDKQMGPRVDERVERAWKPELSRVSNSESVSAKTYAHTY